MKYKSIIILVLAVFLLSMSSVCASEIDDTIASDDINDIGLSADDEIEDNLQTNDENSELTLTDTDVLGADSATYSDLAAEIAQSGNIKLKHKNYTYDTGATAITITEENKVIDGDGAVIDMAGSSSMQAFYAVASGVTIKNLTIKNSNSPNDGAAIFFRSSGTVTNCNFTDNSASRDGGAVYFNVDGNVSNCNFVNNHAYRYGGAVYFNVDGNVSNCNFINNSVTIIGGAIRFLGEGNVSNCNFIDNSAYNGGAVYFYNKNSEVINCNFTDNSAYNGGAVYFYNKNGEVINCNFINNTATDNGGAIRFYDGGAVLNCNFTNNTSIVGGAIASRIFNAVTVDTCIFKTSSDTTDNILLNPGLDINVDDVIEGFNTTIRITINNPFNGVVTVIIGDKNYTVPVINGIGSCNITDLKAGNYTATVILNQTDKFQALNKTVNFTVKSKENPILVDPGLNINIDNITEGSNATILITTNNTFNGDVTVIIGDKNYTVTLVNGEGSCNITDLKAGNYTATVILKQTDKFNASSKIINFTVKSKPMSTVIKSSAVTTTYATSKNIIITLTDKQGKVLTGKKVNVVLNGVTKMLTTNNKGQIILATGTTLTPKTYKVSFKFTGDNNYMASSGIVNLVVKKSTPKLTAKNKKYKAKTKNKKYTITLKNDKKQAIKNAKLTLKVNGKTYTAKTNNKGQATFKIKKLTKKGKYKTTITFPTNQYYNKITTKTTITIK